MARSNSPQALTVVSVTHEGNPELTAQEILKFDDREFGFSHSRTWEALPSALTGKIDPTGVRASLIRTHPRVANCIAGLCTLGRAKPRQTFKLRDHPDAGIKEVEDLKLKPGVTVLARASCWYVIDGAPIIPVLQPRKASFSLFKLAIYVALIERAYVHGDWANAQIEIVDLSETDKDGTVHAKIIKRSELPAVSEDDINAFLATYLEGQEIAEAIRRSRPPSPPKKRKRRDERPSLFPDPEEPTS